MRLFVLTFLVFSFNSYAQFKFEGTVLYKNKSTTAYLSLVEDYRKTSRVYFEQIIKKTEVDSLGYFMFEGNNLHPENRIYRIHIDWCSHNSIDHFLGQCKHQESILFIANNSDQIYFPLNRATDESFCAVESTNPKSSLLLELNALKEQMVYDISEYPSETNLKMNSEKWFSQFKTIGTQAKEPLAELYCYAFLSDRSNETYSYYLSDLTKTNYYEKLQNRLAETYPNAEFTKQYTTEINADLLLFSNKKGATVDYKWILTLLLGISILVNLYFLYKLKLVKSKTELKMALTSQEKKIVDAIIEGKTNKEIAADLFISISTVKTHINNLYKKLGVTDRKALKNLHK